MSETIYEVAGLAIVITERGFTVWDQAVGKWVIDASAVVEDRRIRIADTRLETKTNPAPHIHYDAYYKKRPRPVNRRNEARKRARCAVTEPDPQPSPSTPPARKAKKRNSAHSKARVQK